MKIQICDVCLAEGKLSQSLFTSGFPRTKFHLCTEHKNYAHGFKTEMESMKALLELETKGLDYLNSNIQGLKKK